MLEEQSLPDSSDIPFDLPVQVQHRSLPILSGRVALGVGRRRYTIVQACELKKHRLPMSSKSSARHAALLKE